MIDLIENKELLEIAKRRIDEEGVKVNLDSFIGRQKKKWKFMT